jgi:hypothetical protein
VRLGLLIIVVPQSHSVGFLWTSDRPVLETSTHYSQETGFYAPAGFELAIPASKRLQTQALDRAATGIGLIKNYNHEICQLPTFVKMCAAVLWLWPGILRHNCDDSIKPIPFTYLFLGLGAAKSFGTAIANWLIALGPNDRCMDFSSGGIVSYSLIGSSGREDFLQCHLVELISRISGFMAPLCSYQPSVYSHFPNNTTADLFGKWKSTLDDPRILTPVDWTRTFEALWYNMRKKRCQQEDGDRWRHYPSYKITR